MAAAEEKTGNKPKGWFSRKHTTNEQHRAAVDVYAARHGKQARRRNADERNGMRAKRTPKQQLAELNRRLGTGVGAQKERVRLNALIS